MEYIQKVIEKHSEFKPGDILFVGSTYETRQEYGFAMYLPGYEKKNDYMTSESGFDLPITAAIFTKSWENIHEMGREKGREPKKNLLENVKYSKLVSDFKETLDKFHKDKHRDFPTWEEDLAEMFLQSDWRDDEGIEEVIQRYKELDLWD